MAGALKNPELTDSDVGQTDVSGLLQNMKSQGLWRASSYLGANPSGKSGTATGFSRLDHHLPDAGWPASGMTEILSGQMGVGEFRLLLPALAALSHHSQRWIMLIRPPCIPYSPALVQAGVNLSQVLICQPGNRRDYLWALENALGSGGCSAVLAWPDDSIQARQIRRLQVASREGRCWGVMFRHEREVKQASPAELRLQVKARQPDRDASAININILKRRGGWESGEFAISFRDELHRPAPDFSEMMIEPQRPVSAPDDRPAHSESLTSDHQTYSDGQLADERFEREQTGGRYKYQ